MTDDVDPGGRAGHEPRTVVVTGGAGGIGLATVRRLLGDGRTHCAVVDRAAGGTEQLIDEWGAERVGFFPGDVTRRDLAESECARIESWGPPLGGLVACAGNQIKAATVDVTEDQWRGVLDVHLDGTLNWCQAVGRRMMQGQGGSIVTLASTAMHFGLPGRAAYACAKAAIGSLTRTLAVEWAHHGIRVNAVAPGWILTQLAQEAFVRDGYDVDAARAESALNRFGAPDEVAGPISFLLSSDAAFITGEVINVDGGYAALKGT